MFKYKATLKHNQLYTLLDYYHKNGLLANKN